MDCTKLLNFRPYFVECPTSNHEQTLRKKAHDTLSYFFTFFSKVLQETKYLFFKPYRISWFHVFIIYFSSILNIIIICNPVGKIDQFNICSDTFIVQLPQFTKYCSFPVHSNLFWIFPPAAAYGT